MILGLAAASSSAFTTGNEVRMQKVDYKVKRAAAGDKLFSRIPPEVLDIIPEPDIKFIFKG